MYVPVTITRVLLVIAYFVAYWLFHFVLIAFLRKGSGQVILVLDPLLPLIAFIWGRRRQ